MLTTLVPPSRQSKLSQDQLVELQKSTHFDKKELQQWYKGESAAAAVATANPWPPRRTPLSEIRRFA